MNLREETRLCVRVYESFNLILVQELNRFCLLADVKSCTEIKPHPVILVAAHANIKIENKGEDDCDDDEAETRGISESVGDINLDDETFDVASLRASSFWNQIDNLDDASAQLVLDGWLMYRMSFKESVMLSVLRFRVTNALAHTATHPEAELPKALRLAIGLTSNIFEKDGYLFSRNDGRTGPVSQQSFKNGHGRPPEESKYDRHGMKRSFNANKPFPKRGGFTKRGGRHS